MISAEECQIMQNPSSSSCSPPIFNGNLNRTSVLAKKTIDDDWNDKAYQDYCSAITNSLSPADHMGTRASKITLDQEYDHLIRTGDINQKGFIQNIPVIPMPVQAIVGSNFPIPENKMMEWQKSCDSQDDYTEEMCVFTDDRMAKTVERRRRRMIKNRESAARSRARKQAYTNQLQHSVSQLRATNNWLRKRKEVITLLNSNSVAAPRHQLRRTSSTEF